MAVTIILALSLLGLVIAFYYSSSVNKIPIDMGVEDKDTRQRLSKIHSAIASGAMAFLKQEYKIHGHLHGGLCGDHRGVSLMTIILIM